MAKRKRSLPYLRYKNVSLTFILALLSYFLFKVVEPAWNPIQLPGSDKPILIYSNHTHDDLSALYVNAIGNAKESITMVMYSLLDPHIIKALQDQSNSGISTYIVCDAKASPGISKKLPKAHIIRRAGKGLTHQKILIIDNQDLWAGSANMTKDSLHVHGNLVFGISHPALAQAIATKIKSMDDDGWSTVPFKHTKTRIGSHSVEFSILPDDQAAVQRIINLLRTAKKCIKVAMFTWTRQDFTQEMIAAAKRGVIVEIVLDRYSGKGASAKTAKMLAEKKIPVRLSTGKGLLHHKFAYIDDEILINGSANWTAAAFEVNDDFIMIVEGLTEEQKEKMNRIWHAIQKESEN